MKAYELFTQKKVVRSVQLQTPEETYVIAEVGINHNGDINLAKELIDCAVTAGCDAVKFQKRTIEIVYSQSDLEKRRESPWGTTQRQQKEGLEFGKAEYDEIDLYCKSRGIEWSASAWDLESLKFVEKYNPPFHKIASALTTNLDFVRAVAALGRPTFMSIGMCTYDQIDEAVKIFQDSGTKLILMHTVSTYPSDLSDLNLLMICELQERYGLPVGYSGHEANVSPSLVAAALGAVVIERHITMSRALYGSDQAASLEPAGLSSLVGSIRKVAKVRGDGVKKSIASELEVAQKLRYWQS
jgi:N-acetylneuraminate synthase